MHTLFSLGTLFIMMGIALRFLNKWGPYRSGVEVRKVLIEEAKKRGDVLRVAKLENEVYVIERKLPMYGNLLVGLGVIIFIAYLIYPKL